MIWTVIRINLQRLLNNRIELLLTFVVPIAFFSIFAVIFGGGLNSSTTPKIKVVAVDQAASDDSARVLEQLRESPGLRFMRDEDVQLDRDDAAHLVRHGMATMAIVIDSDNDQLSAELLADSSDQVAGQVATALVSRSLMMVRAEQQAKQAAMFSPGNANSGNVNGMVSQASHVSEQPNAPAQLATNLADDTAAETSSIFEATPIEPEPLPQVTVVDVMGNGKANPVVSMYAAGIAVMFLLFGATGGGGALLEERESQTLERLLATRLSMDQLLLGKWFYLTSIGVVQVTVMFLWGQFMFGIDLFRHLDGFVMMTVVTASAAAAFGLFLATLCKTRGQLNGLSVILVLSMSALGGSMVPRYVMSDRMREAGLWTFNAWALDGYDKVFWRELPVAELWPQLSVLMLSGAAFLIAARLFAIRWETE